MAGAIPKELPSVFDYDDPRAFLRDLFAFRRARDRRFSQRGFARRAGLASKGHLKAVLDGKLNLTPKAVEQYILGLRLSGKEAECFRLLVRAGQAKDAQEREAARGALGRLRYETVVRRATPAESARAMRWPNFLVMSLLGLRGFKADPAWISRKLEGRISPAEAGEALRFLKERRAIRLRGNRVSVLAPADEEFDTGTASGVDPFLKLVLREASRTPGRDYLLALHLTEAEAADLSRRLVEWLKGNLPQARQGRGKRRLHLVLCNILPVSR